LIFSTTYVQAQHYDTLVGDSSHRVKMMVYKVGHDRLYYPKPKFYSFITNQPRTFVGAAKDTWRKKSLPAIGVMVVTSAILISSDQWIRNEVLQLGKFIGLSPNHDYKNVITLHLGGSPINVYQAPQNLNSLLYSLGEGLPPILIGAGLLVHGVVKNDYRAMSVASQILQSNIAMGLAVQLVKRSTGHESPFVATQSGGAWRPFPAFKTYQHNTPNFDAFPSGHLATVMSTVTVLALNYPEKKWIKPVGYTLMALIGFAMINNGVHWAGDYPLAIGMGYVSAKATVNMNRFVNYSNWERK
jgi:membrane-associated phospholipid phosphatase